MLRKVGTESWHGVIVLTDDRYISEWRKLGPPIGTEAAGTRIDLYLATHYPFFSRSAWQNEVERGVLKASGAIVAKSSYRIRQGDQLLRMHPLDEEPMCNTSLNVLWQDSDIAVLEKPAGLPMHESGRYRRRTVAALISQILGPGWSYVHRLDRETSGVLVCGRTAEMRAKLATQWLHNLVSKEYLAFVDESLVRMFFNKSAGVACSVPDFSGLAYGSSVPEFNLPVLKSGEIRLPIYATRHKRTGRAVVSTAGEEAITKYELLEQSAGVCVFKVRPITGRTNQIRLHFSAVGMPIIGEKVYGVDPQIYELYRCEGATKRVNAMAGFPRHALHASKISFIHPVSNKRVEVCSVLPSDLQTLISKNTNHDV